MAKDFMSDEMVEEEILISYGKELSVAMFEVKTNYSRKYFGTIEEAEEAYFELCNQYDYVVLVKHEPGKEPDVRRTSF